jgi:hypothetical protein
MPSISRGALLLAFLAGTPVPVAAQQRAHNDSTRLVVLVVVDQMRADYLSRFASQYTGGLGRLVHDGSVFLHGQQDHAITETAPGHSTLLSGRTPSHTGIVTNARGVPDPTTHLVGWPDVTGASPRNFNGTELYDWMLAADSNARVLGVSRKDRGAILPVGRAIAPVYWYHDGGFTTSSYYADSLPAWVQRFNSQKILTRLAGTSWRLLLPDSAYSEPDSEPFENGEHDVTFPHKLPADTGRLADDLPEYPVMDSLTLAFAWDGVKALHLGSGPSTDLLTVSLSTTDAVGHAFGVDSREIHDQMLRVDRWLGRFLDSLATVVPRNRMILVLSADHGGTPMPEYAAKYRHQAGGRVWLGDLARRVGGELGRRYHTDFNFHFESGLLSADTDALRARGIDVDSLADAMAAEARNQRGVARVYTPATLRAAPASERDAWLWRRLIPKDFGWLIAASPDEGWVWSTNHPVGEHGSTLSSDLTVPIVFLGAGIPARHWADTVSTTDIAPTLAAMLGIKPTEAVDGQVLKQVIPSPHRQ